MALKIIPLGGLGEIGLNMMIFEYGDTLFVVDAGLMFPEDYMLGIDYVIPDMSYLREKKSKIAGIILTHSHEDHIGALPYLLKDIDTFVRKAKTDGTFDRIRDEFLKEKAEAFEKETGMKFFF